MSGVAITTKRSYITLDLFPCFIFCNNTKPAKLWPVCDKFVMSRKCCAPLTQNQNCHENMSRRTYSRACQQPHFGRRQSFLVPFLMFQEIPPQRPVSATSLSLQEIVIVGNCEKQVYTIQQICIAFVTSLKSYT